MKTFLAIIATSLVFSMSVAQTHPIAGVSPTEILPNGTYVFLTTQGVVVPNGQYKLTVDSGIWRISPLLGLDGRQIVYRDSSGAIAYLKLPAVGGTTMATAEQLADSMKHCVWLDSTGSSLNIERYIVSKAGRFYIK